VDIAAANARWSAALVDELARAGIRDVCVCPGSRSTLLALALAQHPRIKLWMHIDERSASYFALGMAKYQRRAVGLLCTSGSAAANFMPAVVEARYARVPLLVMTADRPHELRDTGAPQTIDQLRLYGIHAKWFVEMAIPEATPAALRYARTIACRAAAEATAAPAGPVHLNFPFREPFIAESPGEPELSAEPSDESPFVTVDSAIVAPSDDAVANLAAAIRGCTGGLIVCGPNNEEDYAEAVGRLGAQLGFPVLADPLSQVRCGPHDRRMVLDSYDALLRVDEFTRRYVPEIVIRFGALPTSKPLVRYLERQGASCRQVFVDGGGGWNDTALLRSQVLRADARIVCERLRDALSDRATPPEAVKWGQAWVRIGGVARDAIARHLGTLEIPFEGKVFAELAALIPPDALLYAGNSMPVRDLDTFFPGGEGAVRFMANRGANGIDGVLSSALGAGARHGGPLVLAVGDLSFYHDSNGLLAGLLHRLRATIVLLNNNGGGIFSFLPQAAHPEHFEQLFGTPHGLDFSRFAAAYGASFTRIATWDEFRCAMHTALGSDGVNIIEVPTERTSNVRLHREVWESVESAVRAAVLSSS
jgi:2-succinyl-5-enolpyruvyl-6-hydroxy-3-cyclohexene-1-carboxylate synthase